MTQDELFGKNLNNIYEIKKSFAMPVHQRTLLNRIDRIFDYPNKIERITLKKEDYDKFFKMLPEDVRNNPNTKISYKGKEIVCRE